MVRVLSIVAAAAVAGVLTPVAGSAQAAGHDHGAAHGHATAPVDCTTLGAPPWTGLSEADRQRLDALQRSVADLSTPEAARAAGFFPALGNIPGMGVHYVHLGRMTAGISIEEPHHLMFSPVDGEERLVGAAFAFADAVDTSVPVPFDSDLAHWHDHPEIAGPGETLHMLHVWFVPSSSGPFAGLNFFLPFKAYGIEPPSGCWMADEEDSQRIQRVAFALAASQGGGIGGGLRGVNTGDIRSVVQGSRDVSEILAAIANLREARSAPVPSIADLPANRAALVTAMGDAASAGDRAAWAAAADRYLADLTAAETAAVEGMLRTLTHAQMSTPEREAARQGSGHQH